MRNEGIVCLIKDELEKVKDGLLVKCPDCGTEEYDCGDVFDEATLEDWLEDWKAWELTDGIYVITDDEDMLYYVVDIEAGDVHVETFEEVFENGNTFAA